MRCSLILWNDTVRNISITAIVRSRTPSMNLCCVCRHYTERRWFSGVSSLVHNIMILVRFHKEGVYIAHRRAENSTISYWIEGWVHNPSSGWEVYLIKVRDGTLLKQFVSCSWLYFGTSLPLSPSLSSCSVLYILRLQLQRKHECFQSPLEVFDAIDVFLIWEGLFVYWPRNSHRLEDRD